MSIMNKVYRIVIICMSLLYLGACKEDRDIAGEQGTLQLSVGMSDKITVASRTLSSEEQTQLEQACKVRIYNETSHHQRQNRRGRAGSGRLAYRTGPKPETEIRGSYAGKKR